MIFQRLTFLVVLLLLTSLNVTAAVVIGQNFEIEPNGLYFYTVENCGGCDRAVAFWDQNLDPDDGKIVDQLRVTYMKGETVLSKAFYVFDVETADRYSFSRVRNKFPFIRKLNQYSVERFIINTEGSDSFSLPRSRQ